MKTFLVIVLTIVFLSPLVQAQSLDEIIKNNLEAKGGIEKINAFKTGKMTGKMMMQIFEMPYNMWFKKPNQVKMEMVFQGANMMMAYDGNIVWQISPFTGSTDARELTGEQAEQFKDTGEMMDEPFIDYQEKSHKIELMGKEDLEGTEVFKLKLSRKDGQEIYYFIDTEAFIQLKTSTTRKKQDGTEIKIDTIYGDYKPVAGVMTPHSLSFSINRQPMSITLDAVEPNVELAEDFFSMPKKKSETPAEEAKK
ncbi:outer membrane lipoprotein carrier protein LolA [Acidobacteriota bacterium]